MTAVVLSPLSYVKRISYSVDATIVICRQCCHMKNGQKQTGHELVSAVSKAAEGTGISVRSVACLGNCQKGLNAALMASDSWSYVFQELDITNASDLVQGANSLAFSEDGQVNWSQWPLSLKKKLVSQIPAWNSFSEL